MKILIRIFRTLWGIWWALWFLITVLLFTPFHIIIAPIFGEKAAKFLMFITFRFAAYFVLVPTLTFIKNHGRKEVDTSRSYVVVGNHSSNLDLYVHPFSAPMYIRVLVKRELEKLPLFGSVMKAIAISVDREDKGSRKESLRKLKAKLDLGYSIFIYPEGTRNKTDEPLGKIKYGAFRLAIENQLPLLVSTIANARDVNDNRNGVLDYCPGVVHVYWDKAIETTGMTMDDAPALAARAEEIMRGHILHHRK